ncbi:hypothetical protein RB195_008272 [Necator americanus]|uniref:Uncharacterized protein n=1 Tax=Necator americanus TaxID=51031 RepID=A0ABR1CMS9_NECAM
MGFGGVLDDSTFSQSSVMNANEHGQSLKFVFSLDCVCRINAFRAGRDETRRAAGFFGDLAIMLDKHDVVVA